MGSLFNIPDAPVRGAFTSISQSGIDYSESFITDIELAQATADGKIVTFCQNAVPSGEGETYGDLWIDLDDNHKTYRYQKSLIDGSDGGVGGNAFYLIQDDGINAAAAAAASAQSTADGKITTWYESTPPAVASMSEGDLWLDTSSSTQNMFRYDDNFSGTFTGYKYVGAAWSAYGEWTVTSLPVLIDIDDLKIYQYKTYLVVSTTPKTGEFNTISAAVSALATAGGGTIFIKTGTYTPTSTTTIPDVPIDFIGEDGAVIAVSTAYLPFLDFDTVGSVYSVSNLKFTGTYDSENIFRLADPSSTSFSFTLKNCTFNVTTTDSADTGQSIVYQGSSYPYGYGKITISNNIVNSAAPLIYIEDYINGNVLDLITVKDNTIIGSIEVPIYLRCPYDYSRCIVTGNTLSDIGTSNQYYTKNIIGLYVTGNNLTIENNAVQFRGDCLSNGSRYGFSITGHKVRVVSNSFTYEDTDATTNNAARVYGIYVGEYGGGASNLQNVVVVSNNQVHIIYGTDYSGPLNSTYLHGIILNNKKNGSVTGNIVYLNQLYGTASVTSRYGIRLANSLTDNMLINSNSIKIENDETTTLGIYLDTGVSNSNVDGNVIQVGTTNSVPTTNNGTNCTIANNVIS